MEDKFGGKEYWWEFLSNVLEQKYQRGEPLITLGRNVKNKILEIGKDYFKVKSEQGKKDRNITKERVEFVLCVLINRGYFDSKVANEYTELRYLNDKSGEIGAHTSIIRALLVNLPFIEKEKRSRIVFLPAYYDKDKWGIKV